MPRSTRLSGPLPTPPKSLDGSQSSDSNCDDGYKNCRGSISSRATIASRLATSEKPPTRVLRRQSTQNIAAEIRAFFAVSALPVRKSKKDFLLAAVDRVSMFWDGPPKDHRSKESSSSPDNLSNCRSTTNSLDQTKELPKKHWLTSGLYGGVRPSADSSKVRGRDRKSDPGPGAGTKFQFTLPIFHGKLLIDQRRDFKLPWNLYATTGEICTPPHWSRIKRSMCSFILPPLTRRHICGR